jgi:tetratricopeptide (TPR) repeat protein
VTRPVCFCLALLAAVAPAGPTAAEGMQAPVKAPARSGPAPVTAPTRASQAPDAPEPAAAAVVAATGALAAGDLDQAAALANGHLRQHPRSAAARVVLARVHMARGDLDAAWRALDRAVADHPRDVDALYYLGQVAAQLAAEQFERLAQQSPMPARGHQVLAESLEAQERRSEAEREYQAALDAKPDLLEALLGLARLQRIRLDCDGARTLYARAEAVRPTFEAAYGLGACLLREQAHDAARAQFEKAVARDPRSVVALVGLGSALLGLNRAAEAIVPLERAVAIEPVMDDGWYVLGRAYQAAGRPELAQRAFATVERLRAEKPR